MEILASLKYFIYVRRCTHIQF